MCGEGGCEKGVSVYRAVRYGDGEKDKKKEGKTYCEQLFSRV